MDQHSGERVRHDPTYLCARRAHWATCTCGWKSTHYTTGTGAQYAFGEHLRDHS